MGPALLSFNELFSNSKTSTEDLNNKLTTLLRYTIALCFIGHGVWGLITKAEWLPFFNSMNIPDSVAWFLMPIIGLLDITVGISILLSPRRAVLFWSFLWCFWTALMRPLSGHSMWEVWERAGNFLPPLIFLIMLGPFTLTIKNIFQNIERPTLDYEKINILEFFLRLTLALLLIGHGGFCIFDQKIMLVKHLSTVGFPSTYEFLTFFGIFEFVLAFLVLFSTSTYFFGFVLIFKVFTELLYPISGRFIDIFETIERFGDYGTPLAIIFILQWRAFNNKKFFNISPQRENIFRAIIYSHLSGALLISLSYSLFNLFENNPKKSFAFVRHNLKEKKQKNINPINYFTPRREKLVSGKELLKELHKGDNIILFRHFATDYRKYYFDKTRAGHGTLSAQEIMNSCDKQRPLSPLGKTLAQTVRFGFQKLKIPIGEVVTSPYCRNIEGTQLAFGQKYKVERDLIYRASGFTVAMMNDHLLKESRKPFRGNKILMAHRTHMDHIAHINEGESFIFKRVNNKQYDLIGIVKVEEWPLAVIRPEILGMGRIQEEIFSKKMNSVTVKRDKLAYKEIMKLKTLPNKLAALNRPDKK